MVKKNEFALVTIVNVFGRERIYVQNQFAKDLVDGRQLMTAKEMEGFEADGIEFEIHPLAQSV